MEAILEITILFFRRPESYIKSSICMQITLESALIVFAGQKGEKKILKFSTNN